MKNIAIIPARSGSKGLKDKNIKLLHGKPLMAYSIECALGSGMFDCVHVSTDSREYADIAKVYGAEVPFLRSEELSSDIATTWDAMRFVLREYEIRGSYFDTFTVLQPTSPLRTAEDIQKAFQVFKEKEAEAVVSVCEIEHSPLWSNTLPGDRCLKGFIREEANEPRQKLSTYYRVNGAIYILNTEFLMAKANIYGEHSYAYVMPKERSVDIDHEVDFLMAGFLMEYRDTKSKF